MPAATAAAFTGIHNENEFYSHHYLSEIFSGDVRSTVDRWRESAEAGGGQTPYAALRALAGDAARALRLTLDELLTIYRVHFPVMRQYEADTWYDAKGCIVFTVSKGLPGVGLPRKAVKSDTAWTLRRPAGVTRSDTALGWEDIRDLRAGLISRRAQHDTFPGGPVQRVIEYHAPFDRCDREREYRTAWNVLRSRFPSRGEAPRPHRPSEAAS